MEDNVLSNVSAPRASVVERDAVAFCFPLPLLLSVAGAGMNAEAARKKTTRVELDARTDAAQAATLSRGARSCKKLDVILWCVDG